MCISLSLFLVQMWIYKVIGSTVDSFISSCHLWKQLLLLACMCTCVMMYVYDYEYILCCGVEMRRKLVGVFSLSSHVGSGTELRWLCLCTKAFFLSAEPACWPNLSNLKLTLLAWIMAWMKDIISALFTSEPNASFYC